MNDDKWGTPMTKRKPPQRCGKPMVLFKKMIINDLSSWWIFQIFHGIEWNSLGVSLADVENPW